MKNNRKMAKRNLIFLLVIGLTVFNGLALDTYKSDPIVLENEKLNVSIDSETGCFSVTEKTSGHVWKSDPWENAAGLLTITDSKGKKHSVNISKSKKIEVSKTSNNTVSLKFNDPVLEDGSVATGVSIVTELKLDAKTALLDVEVKEHNAGNFKLSDLRYPARAFSLKTDEDKGAAVIPQKQGIICPSYIFPMNGGRFCKWDDATYNNKSQGFFRVVQQRYRTYHALVGYV
nr:hypothetical protein [Zobellia laminariae]